MHVVLYDMTIYIVYSSKLMATYKMYKATCMHAVILTSYLKAIESSYIVDLTWHTASVMI